MTYCISMLVALMFLFSLNFNKTAEMYLDQKSEIKKIQLSEENLRTQIEILKEQKINLDDTYHVVKKARERLGFVFYDDIPYQIQVSSEAILSMRKEVSIQIDLDKYTRHFWCIHLWYIFSDRPSKYSLNLN